MTISQILLPEFDMEMAKTRTALERVPMDKLYFKPHEKSLTMGHLAGHLAEIPNWGAVSMNQDSFDVQPPGAPPYAPPIYNTSKDLLALFDKNIAAARSALAGATDEAFTKPWSLLRAGQTMFTMPRLAVFRNMIMNHNIHHRAQLGVYFRLCGVSVPSTYGPSADEGFM